MRGPTSLCAPPLSLYALQICGVVVTVGAVTAYLAHQWWLFWRQARPKPAAKHAQQAADGEGAEGEESACSDGKSSRHSSGSFNRGAGASTAEEGGAGEAGATAAADARPGQTA